MSQDGMLISIGKINEFLFDQYFCVPPYNSINGQWVSECFNKINDNKIDQLKFHVTKEVVLPWRRAYQTTYFYSELAPFKELIKIIDSATLAYYDDNWLCSYITLTPVIEAVIDRWGKLDIDNYDDSSPLAQKAEALLKLAKSKLNSNMYWHQYLLIQHKYLDHILKNIFFKNGTKYKKQHDDGFNRNVISHLLEVPDIFTNNIHTLRLFLLLDILAALYSATHPDDCKGISPVRDATHKQDLMNTYFNIFNSSCTRSIIQGNYSITLQKRIYDIYGVGL
tara:strand:- start:1711 stop:2550 length:840 start_codon:yes stop_codon:yes gene_type:complete